MQGIQGIIHCVQISFALEPLYIYQHSTVKSGWADCGAECEGRACRQGVWRGEEMDSEVVPRIINLDPQPAPGSPRVWKQTPIRLSRVMQTESEQRQGIPLYFVFYGKVTGCDGMLF